MGGGCGPNCTTFTLNVPLSSLSDEELESIRQSIIELLQELGPGRVTVSFRGREGLTKADASTENPVNDEALDAKVTKAGDIQTLGNSNFIIAKINGTSMKYNNKLIIVKTDNTIAYVDYDVGEAGIVKRSDWENVVPANEIKHLAFGKDVTKVSQVGFGFNLSTSLATITFPVSVILQPIVFSGCTSLISVFLTAGLLPEGGDIAGVFDGCTSVLAYTADRESPRYSSVEGVLFSKNKTKLELFPLGDTRTEYTVPEGVTTIMPDAFLGFTSLASITLPEGVTVIGGQAFKGCTSLASITIPETVTRIEGEAFRGCTSLDSINLPEGLTGIGDSAFQECTSLTSITIPYTVTVMGDTVGLVFDSCSELKTVTFEGERDKDVELTLGMFVGCIKLEEIDLPEGVLFDISGSEPSLSVFEGCTSLAKVTVRDPRVEEYLVGAFQDVPAVKDGSLNFNVANDLDEIQFGALNEAFSNKSTELDPPNKLYFGDDDSGGVGLKKVLLTQPS